VERENQGDGFLSNIEEFLVGMSKEDNGFLKGSRFSLRHFGLIGIALLVLMVGASGNVASSTGIDLNGKDIVDNGDVIWDASNGYVPTGQINDGPGSGLDADTLTGNTTNDIQSCTTASDVGFGNADNADELDLDGSETMNGNLDLGSNNLDSAGGIFMDDNGNILLNDGRAIGGRAISQTGDPGTSSANYIEFRRTSLYLSADSGECNINGNGNGEFNCDGTKNWIHDLGNNSEAVYTSQESPEVRAVYEGQTTVENSVTTVNLPSHFEKTVSDTKPMLRVQATPHELATVAVTERSDSSLTIETSRDVMVDYRVTGIREGYEDNQVVIEK